MVGIGLCFKFGACALQRVGRGWLHQPSGSGLREVVEEDVLERISGFEADEAAREVVVELRDGLLDIFADYGATHFQVGRTYRYSKNIKPETLDLITGIKNVIDPKGLMNPGSLGLG